MLTSCVFWFVSLNASSHLCFRFCLFIEGLYYSPAKTTHRVTSGLFYKHVVVCQNIALYTAPAGRRNSTHLAPALPIHSIDYFVSLSKFLTRGGVPRTQNLRPLVGSLGLSKVFSFIILELATSEYSFACCAC